MITQILGALYFMLPAYVGNMAPVFFSRMKFFSTPIDFGKKISGKEVFGPHKTYRGFVVGMAFGALTCYLQKVLSNYPFFQTISFVDYNSVWLTLGLLLSFGALFGDLIKSFFKRRLNITSGESWLFFDQLDFVIGALAFGAIIVDFTFVQIASIVIISPILHVISSYAGYLTGLKKNKI